MRIAGFAKQAPLQIPRDDTLRRAGIDFFPHQRGSSGGVSMRFGLARVFASMFFVCNSVAMASVPPSNELPAYPLSGVQYGPVYTAWYQDRYQPHTFQNTGTFNQRSNVLDIGVARRLSSCFDALLDVMFQLSLGAHAAKQTRRLVTVSHHEIGAHAYVALRPSHR